MIVWFVLFFYKFKAKALFVAAIAYTAIKKVEKFEYLPYLKSSLFFFCSSEFYAH